MPCGNSENSKWLKIKKLLLTTRHERISFMTNSFELYDFGLALSIKLNEKFLSAVKKAERVFRKYEENNKDEKVVEKQHEMKSWMVVHISQASKPILLCSCTGIVLIACCYCCFWYKSNFRRVVLNRGTLKSRLHPKL